MHTSIPPSDHATLRRIPDLHHLECMHATFVRHSFPRHWHDTYVIQWVETGVDRFLCGGTTHEAPAGTFVLINPLEVHTGSAAGLTALRYRSMYPSVESMTRLRAEFPGGCGAPAFDRAVVRDKPLEAMFLRFWSALGDDAAPLRRQTLHTELGAQLIRRHASAGTPRPVGSERRVVRTIKDYLAQNYAHAVSLDDLSRLSGLSPFHLLRAFRKEAGLPPHEFLVAVRVERAKHLLRRRVPIARVAHEVGFADQSHFTRVFKRIVGVTPGRYRS